MSKRTDPTTVADTAGGNVVGQTRDDLTPVTVTDALHTLPAPGHDEAGGGEGVDLSTPGEGPREARDTGDHIDPAADDPTPHEVTDPTDPNHVTPNPDATSLRVDLP